MKQRFRKNGNSMLLMLAFVMGIVSVSVAQGSGYGTNKKASVDQQFCKNIPNLTEDQQKKIETLRSKHLKESMLIKNNMKVKQAELRVLQTADKVDMTAINAKIDEISGLRMQLMKNGAAHKQEIRKILTDEQRVYFDAHAGQGGGHAKGGFYGGHQGSGHRGQGNNPNCPKR